MIRLEVEGSEHTMHILVNSPTVSTNGRCKVDNSLLNDVCVIERMEERGEGRLVHQQNGGVRCIHRSKWTNLRKI